MYHKYEFFSARIEADLTHEYSNANSPKPSPGSIFFLISPSISTLNFPSCNTKKQLA